MAHKSRIAFILAFMLAIALIALPSRVRAETENLPSPTSAYFFLPLSFPHEIKPLVIQITRDQSDWHHWKVGQNIKISVYVKSEGGQKRLIRDTLGRHAWTVTLDENRQATLSIRPALTNFSGRLNIEADGKPLFAAEDELLDRPSRTLEKILESRMEGGARIRVHFTDQILREGKTTATLPQEVLEAAVRGYQTITRSEGFNSPGYSFENPDKNYAHDPDKTIDIYLGNPDTQNQFRFHGFTQASFRDAPCFDTIKVSETAYHAVILLPVNYSEFIKNWEKLNPSSMGIRNVSTDLRGTLIHEMLHVIIFYYNKNLDRDAIREASAGSKNRHLDWYVEGLARYFETLAGARHDFYSQGFKETLVDKVRFSRGGSNYFMRYPDQTFTELRYENALFWRFVDDQYGMKTIEKLSRKFRGSGPERFKQTIEQVTGSSFNTMLKKYALAVLLKNFGLKEELSNLKDVAQTRLILRDSDLILPDGYGEERNLGKTCRTDWIGEWDGHRSRQGQPPVAGDGTDTADVSGWASDYVRIEIPKEADAIEPLKIEHEDGRAPLGLQLVVMTRGGSVIVQTLEDVAVGHQRKVNIESLVRAQGINTKSIAAISMIITNLDPEHSSIYQLRVGETG